MLLIIWLAMAGFTLGFWLSADHKPNRGGSIIFLCTLPALWPIYLGYFAGTFRRET
jgi:hypothetical protein